MGEHHKDRAERAAKKLREIRASRSLKDALDALRHQGYGLDAITAAIKAVEGMDYEDIKRLMDERGDWRDF